MTQRKWTDERVAELRRRHEDGISWRQLAIEHGISRQAMWWVVNREAYNKRRQEWRLSQREFDYPQWGVVENW